MDKFWVQLVLAICTLLGGVAAVAYFHETLRLPSPSSLKQRLFGAPRAPLTPSSISAYVHTNPRSRALDAAIAADFGLPTQGRESDWLWLLEQTKSLGLQTLRQLDKLLAKHQRNARLLARTFQPRGCLPAAHGVQLVLEIEAMERFGANWYVHHLGNLQLTSAGRGYASDLWGYYQQIKAYGA